ncbi:MAG TPA: tetratricopeptide repeat protein, partial [Burkholderiaceae bacterium]|nr:tetratricopeptide repeat protein [Burkholderiaceae bacterium]
MSVPSPPMPVAQLFEQARHCLFDGRIEEAEAHCRRVLKLQPRNSDALLVLALCRHDRGDFTGALKHLAGALRLEPRSAALHVAYANSLRAIGKRESAVEH